MKENDKQKKNKKFSENASNIEGLIIFENSE